MSRSIRNLLAWGVERGLPSRTGLTRRDFLRGTAGAAVGAAMTPLFTSSCTTRPAPAPLNAGAPVVVIGAGLAGLACADELHRAGVQVTVLEAQGQVGGRASTDRTLLPGAAIERGGHLIGKNHPSWLALASRLGLHLAEVPSDEGEQVVQIGGRVLRGKDAERVYSAVDEAIARLLVVAASVTDVTRPWNTPGAEQLDRTSFETFVQNLTPDPDARRLIDLQAASDNGVEASRMSLLAFLAMVKGGGLVRYFTDSEIYCCSEGNAALAERLAEGLGPSVRLNHSVQRIDLNQGLVWTSASDQPAEAIPARAVVLAAPSTCWPDIAVEPALPALLKPQMGRNVKVVSVSASRPWKTAGVKSEVMGEKRVTTTWIAAETQEEVALCLFSGGVHAERLAASDDPQAAALADTEELIPGLSTASKRTAFYNWLANPRTRGSYHFPAPGEVTTLGPTLVDGIRTAPTPLHFAGEGVSYAFMGYMEGALSSGIRTARELITFTESRRVHTS